MRALLHFICFCSFTTFKLSSCLQPSMVWLLYILGQTQLYQVQLPSNDLCDVSPSYTGMLAFLCRLRKNFHSVFSISLASSRTSLCQLLALLTLSQSPQKLFSFPFNFFSSWYVFSNSLWGCEFFLLLDLFWNVFLLSHFSFCLVYFYFSSLVTFKKKSVSHKLVFVLWVV